MLKKLLLILGISIFSISVWIFGIAPQLTKLPHDFRYSADIFSQDNFYDEKTHQYTGPVYTKTHFSYGVEQIQKNAYIIQNKFDVKTPDGKKVFTVERLYGVNPYTRTHIANYGDKEREGYLFAPRNLQKQPFTYWHINYNTPAHMKFSYEEEIDGLKTYVYEAHYHADQTENLTHLPDVGIKKGVNLDIHLKLWIEPLSGHIINYKDVTTAYFYDLKFKNRIAPWNAFTNTFTQKSIEDHILLARSEKTTLLLVWIVIPIVIFLLGVALFLFCIIRTNTYKKLGIYKFTVMNILLFLLPICSLIMTFIGWRYTVKTVESKLQNQFEAEITGIEEHIMNRFEIYGNVLQGAKGLFIASGTVSRTQWKDYIESINIEKHYPGIQGIGFATHLSAGEKVLHEQYIRAEGFTDYKVWPAGDREEYTPITYLEPFSGRNLRAFGYDMFAEPVRRSAMIAARDSGNQSVSGKVTLVQETNQAPQAGFLMYVPLYKDKSSDLAGYVYSPFRMNDFMEGVLQLEQYDTNFAIFDGTELTKDNLLYTYQSKDTQNYTKTFKKVKTIYISGHPWTIEFINTSTLDITTLEILIPYIVLVGGILFSLLLFAFIYALVTSRFDALAYAEMMTKSLQQEKAKDEAILSSIGEGLVATDKNGVIISINNVAKRLLGIKQPIGEKFTSVTTLEDDNGVPLPEPERPLIQTLRTGHMNIMRSTEFFYKREDSTKIPVALTVSPIMMHKKLIGAVTVFRDITKEKEIDKSKTEFVSLASHELRTPIGVIKWYLEAIYQDNDFSTLSEKFKNYLHEIKNNQQRLLSIVHDLLNVSKIDQNKIINQPVSTDVAAIFESVIKQMQVIAQKKKVQFIYPQGFKSLPLVTVDPQRFYETLENILSNAIKYNTEGGTVTITFSHKKDKLEISISDTGIGIPKENISKLFSKFYRADNAIRSNADGTGLGLYVTKFYIESWGGSIHIKSTEHKGTTVILSLLVTQKRTL